MSLSKGRVGQSPQSKPSTFSGCLTTGQSIQGSSSICCLPYLNKCGGKCSFSVDQRVQPGPHPTPFGASSTPVRGTGHFQDSTYPHPHTPLIPTVRHGCYLGFDSHPVLVIFDFPGDFQSEPEPQEPNAHHGDAAAPDGTLHGSSYSKRAGGRQDGRGCSPVLASTSPTPGSLALPTPLFQPSSHHG